MLAQYSQSEGFSYELEDGSYFIFPPECPAGVMLMLWKKQVWDSVMEAKSFWSVWRREVVFRLENLCNRMEAGPKALPGREAKCCDSVKKNQRWWPRPGGQACRRWDRVSRAGDRSDGVRGWGRLVSECTRAVRERVAFTFLMWPLADLHVVASIN